MKTSIGDRMKGYESANRMTLTKRMPMIIRCDGKAFHTFTKGMEKPWSSKMKFAMTSAANEMLKQIQGAKIAYIQSDEISVLVTDYDSINFEPWFGKSVQKIASVSASIATMAFNKSYEDPTALFDSRCFVLPKEEVVNYFLWRQQDAIRNSIQALAQYHFAHKELQNKNVAKIRQMLVDEKQVVWDDCPTWQKRGWCCSRISSEKEIDGKIVNRTVAQEDLEVPIFSTRRDYIDKLVHLE